MPSNDLEVFDHLQTDHETSLEIDYLAYAIFALKKKCWIDWFHEIHGAAPTQTEIDAWIAHLSPYEFDAMRSEAIDFFHAAATDYMQSAIARAREEGARDSISQSIAQISNQLRAMGRFRFQLVISLMTAILTPIILGGSIFFWKQYEASMPTPLRIFSGQTSTSLPTARPPPAKQPE